MATPGTAQATILLNLELSGGPPGTEGQLPANGLVRKVKTPEGNMKLMVHLPRLIDAEQANRTADLLFEEIDRLACHAIVERITLKSSAFYTRRCSWH